jgi:hypothetical protein
VQTTAVLWLPPAPAHTLNHVAGGADGGSARGRWHAHGRRAASGSAGGDVRAGRTVSRVGVPRRTAATTAEHKTT